LVNPLGWTRIQGTSPMEHAPKARLSELLNTFGCADVVAPMDLAAYCTRAIELITKGAAATTSAGFVGGRRIVQSESSSPSAIGGH